MLRLSLIACAIIGYFETKGQNLVANPSFENIQSCPTDFFQIYKAIPWFSPDCAPLRPDTHGYGVLFSGCNFGNAGVPKNAICTQYAHTGFSYAGIEVVSAYDGVYRQYIEQQLAKPLALGKNYFFSMFFNLCTQYTSANGLPCFIPDSTGVAFTSNVIDKNPYCLALPMQPDVYGKLPPVTQGENWHQIEGCYVAKGGEQYLTIGNFAGEKVSSCSANNHLAYFIFIDDISLFEEVKKDFDTTLCSDEIWKFDAKTLRDEYKLFNGWTFSWSDGDTSSVRNFTKAQNLKLIVSKNRCFNDIYNFNIKYQNFCTCDVHVSNAFTPNGDRINEIFKPNIDCKDISISNYYFSVFNRWGQKIFSTSDKSVGWNGRYKGSVQGNGVFAWLIEYDVAKGLGKGRKSVHGTVILIKQ